ncbi:MAG: 4Fe-4S single cluster domain-containing protein [Anaeromassilibacillus sp.]
MPESIVDGKGIRYVIFTQGCPHHCPAATTPDARFRGRLSGGYGRPPGGDAARPVAQGVTFSGEPFCQPAPLAELARKIHESGLDVTVYTGYTYEQLLEQHNPDTDALLQQADVLIDGRYEQDKRDLTLRFRGSSNQRVIDLNRTRAEGRVVVEQLDEE